MMKKNYRKLAVVIAIMMLTLSIASTGFAANTMENLKAYYKNITIFKNGIQATFTHEPFIVDGTTYVPVRDMSELLGKSVTFNPTTYRIDIADVVDANTIALQTKVVQQEITIKNLETQITTLKAQLDDDDDKKEYDLDDMEDYLNDEYDEYKDVEFDIRLKGDEDDIEVQIFVDLDDYEDDWDDISITQIKSYIKNIVDDILDEFDDADVEGFIEDTSWDEELVYFELKSNGTIVYEFDGSSGSSSGDIDDLDDMAKDLDRTYSSKNGIEEIELEEDGDDIYIIVYVNKTTWNKLSESSKELILEDIYEDIRDEDFDNTLYGEIKNDTTGTLLYEFDYSSKGVVDIYIA